ncbi:ARM REPEAT PROTEIN INTERACTING WITH ABF2-like isoform X1 [Vicia villosa]|uniref:ARM REPEAT PROTEIN INTERACTING WITH ABF2-like isoform X1 n=1 Tax=Vicia villosa TaxID=3911 RepID=UPI00273AAB88|nr:ARM REPEAT PROTEIN INTERACTING WITH ABF2-like isoform X1 [Vicia villosa]
MDRKLTLKRKFDFTEDDESTVDVLHETSSLADDITKRVDRINSVSLSSDQDIGAAQNDLCFLSGYAKDEDIVDLMVVCGVVPTMVKVLDMVSNRGELDANTYDVEKDCVSILGHLAVKPENQQLIVDAGALPCLVELLMRPKAPGVSQALFSRLLGRVADAITNLAHENINIKTLVRLEGGIPPLVDLLESNDKKVQRAAAGALRTLAFQNAENKDQVVDLAQQLTMVDSFVIVAYKNIKLQIVECDALPTLVLMLGSEDPAIHYEAVGVIGNLVHSSPEIKKEVLLAEALQPVICLLSSPCLETQREAALLIGQFATTDSDCKIHIAQRGAINPLIKMLKSPDLQLREMSTFALGRLAQDSHNQAGIAYNGGIEPLLNLLATKNASVQHNAAFALYALADNEDNVPLIIKADGLQKLQDGHFSVLPTRECVAKMLKRLEEKMEGRVLKQMLHLMRSGEKVVQKRVALALAHLCSADDRKTIFIDNNGLELLLEHLESSNKKQKREASAALHAMATKGIGASIVDLAPTSPTSQVYLGEQYVNNPLLSDVTFLVEGKIFYAHKVCLVSSIIFRAMFDGGYREKEAKDIEIPNIKWNVFELMMRFIYTGTVEVDLEVAPDLLKAADQYLLDGLKRICESVISKDISVENVSLMYVMSDTYNATTLKYSCILFILEQFDNLSSKPWYCRFIRCIKPDIWNFFWTLLITSKQAD